MGSIGGLIGVNGGAGGTGFAGPASASIATPVTTGQANNAYTGVQNSMTSQNALLQALQAQQGLQNQSNVYGQLQGIAAGQGPNPAQAMLNQQTGQNVANQAALMAGQRGASSNAGLIARQAAQQGAATQQNAVGQAASLQAQQSLNALGAAGNLATTQAQQQIGQTNANTQAQQAEQANLLNSIAGVNNANVGMQSNVNNVNGQLANTQLQGQQGLLGGMMNGAGSLMSMMGSSGMAEGGEVDGGFDSQVNVGPAPNTSTPAFGSDSGAQALGGSGGSGGKSSGGGSGGGGGGGILSLAALLADGGQVPSTQPKSMFGKYVSGVKNGSSSAQGPFSMGSTDGAQSLNQGMTNLGQGLVSALGRSTSSPQSPLMAGGPGDSMSNGPTMPGTEYAAKGGNIGSKLKQGGHVPGKPKVGGTKNSYANDTVKALLSPGEIVIPRSITQGADPVNNAARFVQAVLARKGKR